MLNRSCVPHFHCNDFFTRWLFKEKTKPRFIENKWFSVFLRSLPLQCNGMNKETLYLPNKKLRR